MTNRLPVFAGPERSLANAIWPTGGRTTTAVGVIVTTGTRVAVNTGNGVAVFS